MKFSAREDIAAPVEQVFQVLTDFDAIERQALRRGAEVERTDRLTHVGVGMSWRVSFDLRGRRRRAETTLTAYEPDRLLVFLTTSKGVTCTADIDLSRLGPERTRMMVGLELRPQTFRARLTVQALRLVKGALSKRFKARVARIARQIPGST